MAVVSDQTIAAAALAAGFPRDRVATAVAVALAESGGDATASSGDRRGLWGIKTADVGSANWSDPAVNAGLAYTQYTRAGNTFDYWSGNLIKRLALMARGTMALIESAAVGAVLAPGDGDNPLIPDAIENAGDAVTGLADQAGDLVALLRDRDFWVRAGLFLAGGLLVIVAVVWLGSSLVGGKAAKLALNVVSPAGKAGAVGKALT